MTSMKRQFDQRRPARTNRIRGLAWFLLVPMLLFAQLFGGRTALIHSHGDEGGHIHVLAPVTEEGTAHLNEAWHRAQHDEGEDHLPAPAEDPGADLAGLLVQVPATIVVAPTIERLTGKSTASLLTTAASERAVVAHEYWLPPPLAECLDRPQNRRQRSGIATLLRSSRAILI